jgi:hypothetical protein
MHTCRSGIILFMVALFARPAVADIVVNPSPTGATTLNTAFGQSFTATSGEASVKTVSFAWESDFNDASPDPNMTAHLYSGFGFGGILLASQSIAAIPDSTPKGTWIDFTFGTPVDLTSGNVYSLRWFKTNGGSVSGGQQIAGNVYAGGAALTSSGTPFTNDILFRVLAVSVPEASSIAFFSAALAATGLVTYSRRKGAVTN